MSSELSTHCSNVRLSYLTFFSPICSFGDRHELCNTKHDQQHNTRSKNTMPQQNSSFCSFRRTQCATRTAQAQLEWLTIKNLWSILSLLVVRNGVENLRVVDDGVVPYTIQYYRMARTLIVLATPPV